MSAASAASAEPRAITAGTEAGVHVVEQALAALRDAPPCATGAPYGRVRRALGAAEPFVRAGARGASEVIFGPPRTTDEGAGAVAALDGALAAGDCAGARSQRFQIEQALALARRELLDDARLGDAALAQALSDASYELGLALLQARPSSSQDDEGDRGEARGLAEAIATGARALWTTPPERVARALAALDGIDRAVADAPSMAGLGGRARSVRSTGAIGLDLREAARARGLDVRGPYRPRGAAADAPVSALTLPPARTPFEPALAGLGARLFVDRRLSRGGQRSCASCHDPARAFTDGRATARSLLPGAPIRRNAPTLLYDGLQAAQLWDGRVLTADRQALRVVHNRAELGLDDAELVAAVAADPAYASAFGSLAPDGVTAAAIGRALGAYVTSLGPGSAPIDAFDRGDDAALTPEADRGLDVLAGPGRCARCHVPPLWGGSRPTDFAVTIYGVLGVPSAPEARRLDDDPGRFDVTRAAADRRAFKTPTLRDVGETAPYFHHGRFRTLEQVVDLYDRGGGRGLGLDVPNQDPDVRPLHLDAAERRALLAFLREGLRDAPVPR